MTRHGVYFIKIGKAGNLFRVQIPECQVVSVSLFFFHTHITSHVFFVCVFFVFVFCFFWSDGGGFKLCRARLSILLTSYYIIYATIALDVVRQSILSPSMICEQGSANTL